MKKRIRAGLVAVAAKLGPVVSRAPVPVFPLQPVLLHLVRGVARRHPEIFDRLGPHTHKRFLIDPVNLPFVFLLRPNPHHPTLTAYRRKDLPACDARMAGTFLTLLDLVDGKLDSDALFFSRALTVEGDTEAVVVLRNALDDLDESVIRDILRSFGPLGAPARFALKALRRLKPEEDSAPHDSAFATP